MADLVGEARALAAEVRQAEGRCLAAAQNHLLDRERACCTCGFGVWSAEHVLIMALREGLDLRRLAGLVERLTDQLDAAEAEKKRRDEEWQRQLGRPHHERRAP